MSIRRQVRLLPRRLRPLRRFGVVQPLMVAGFLLVAIVLLVSIVRPYLPSPSRTGGSHVMGSGGTSAVRDTSPATSESRGGTKAANGKGAGAHPGSWRVALGLYAGPIAATAPQTLASQIGHPVPYAMDYLDGSSWQSISDPSWFLQGWAGSGLHMIFNVPMLPSSGATLAAGAAGSYDGQFAALAQALVDNNQASAVLVLGWDANAPGLPWSVSTNAQAHDYVAYWRRIVAAMRSVPGARFEFAWDVGGGPEAIAPSTLYPGRKFVDVVATDIFDISTVTTAQRWLAIEDEPYGPEWFASFATLEDKPLMIAKWGVVPTTTSGGGGDDPAFVQGLLSWAAANHVVAAVVWNYGTWAISDGAFPASEAVLRSSTAVGS
jgi:hypothetical protein